MKLPKPLLRIIWCAIGVGALGVAACFWIVWPELTSREFVTLVGNGQFDDANRFFLPPARWAEPKEGFVQLDDGETSVLQTAEFFQSAIGKSPDFESRTVADVLAGRRKFSRRFRFAGYGFEFTAERGKIHYHLRTGT